MLRVIGGKARGRLLKVPGGPPIRPTADKVRESLFNIIGPNSITGARFMDLFAGSGAIGIEALSRGAEYTTFIDCYPKHVKVIHENLNRCEFQSFSEVICDDVYSVLDRFSRFKPRYNIIFADPPYQFIEWKLLLIKIITSVSIPNYGFIIIEHASKSIIPAGMIDMPLYGQYKYGDSTLTVFRKS